MKTKNKFFSRKVKNKTSKLSKKYKKNKRYSRKINKRNRKKTLKKKIKKQKGGIPAPDVHLFGDSSVPDTGPAVKYIFSDEKTSDPEIKAMVEEEKKKEKAKEIVAEDAAKKEVLGRPDSPFDVLPFAYYTAPVRGTMEYYKEKYDNAIYELEKLAHSLKFHADRKKEMAAAKKKAKKQRKGASLLHRIRQYAQEKELKRLERRALGL